MTVRDTGAEQLIIDTAKRMFFAEGKLNATTQDIADAAGITRTLVNYYFRSKDVLFEQVLRDAMHDMGRRIDEVLSSEVPFKQKVESFIDVFSTEIANYPYKETFFISEINCQCFTLPKKERSVPVKKFLNEIEQAADQGMIKPMAPMNFMINLLSLMAYPMLMRPLFKSLFEVGDSQYEKLLNERKKMIVDILFT